MNYLHLFYFCYDVVYLLYHLNLLRNLDYSLSNLDYWHYLLNDSVNYLVFNLDVVLDFSSAAILDDWNYLLNYLLHLDDLRNLDNSLHDFLYEYWHFNNFLNNLFHLNYLLLNKLNFLILDLNVIHNSLYFNRPVDFHDFVSKDLDFMHFRDLFMKLHYLLDDSRNLYNSFNLALIRDELLDFSLYY